MPRIYEIEGLDAPELEIYSCTSEVRLARYFEPRPGIFIAESKKVIERALDAGYQPLSLLAEKKRMEGEDRALLERCGEIPVYTAPGRVLERLTGYPLTQGVLCAMRRRPLPGFEEVCRNASRIAVLENVMNPTNVGAAFRSAAALGFDALLLAEGCSDPLYRRCIRVSMGTVFQIPWTKLESGDENYVNRLKRLGFSTVAMALRENSVRLDDPALVREERLALFLGSEGEGLREETICACDYTVKIPMSHGVDSLNVAAAGAVAFWQLGRREKGEGNGNHSDQ